MPALSPVRTLCLQTLPGLSLLLLPSLLPQCVAAAWPSRASSSRTKSTSVPMTTSNSMAPAVTAAETSSPVRSSPPWVAPTTPSALCAACAGESGASRRQDPRPEPPGKGRNGLSRVDLGLYRALYGTLGFQNLRGGRIQ